MHRNRHASDIPSMMWRERELSTLAAVRGLAAISARADTVLPRPISLDRQPPACRASVASTAAHWHASKPGDPNLCSVAMPAPLCTNRYSDWKPAGSTSGTGCLGSLSLRLHSGWTASLVCCALRSRCSIQCRALRWNGSSAHLSAAGVAASGALCGCEGCRQGREQTATGAMAAYRCSTSLGAPPGDSTYGVPLSSASVNTHGFLRRHQPSHADTSAQTA